MSSLLWGCWLGAMVGAMVCVQTSLGPASYFVLHSSISCVKLKVIIVTAATFTESLLFACTVYLLLILLHPHDVLGVNTVMI